MGSININTGNTEIDAIETRYSQDILNYQITLESTNGSILNEDGESILTEYRVEEQTKTANNEYFTQQSFEYIDFSERVRGPQPTLQLNSVICTPSCSHDLPRSSAKSVGNFGKFPKLLSNPALSIWGSAGGEKSRAVTKSVNFPSALTW